VIGQVERKEHVSFAEQLVDVCRWVDKVVLPGLRQLCGRRAYTDVNMWRNGGDGRYALVLNLVEDHDI
jgi:hypothetical protein